MFVLSLRMGGVFPGAVFFCVLFEDLRIFCCVITLARTSFCCYDYYYNSIWELVWMLQATDELPFIPTIIELMEFMELYLQRAMVLGIHDGGSAMFLLRCNPELTW